MEPLSNKVWVASDLHFGHQNIIRYCNRPYKNSLEMDESLIRRWNSRVGKNEDVFFLGDFAFDSRERISKLLSLLNFRQLFIVEGNHDEKIRIMWEHPVEPVWLSLENVVGVRVVEQIHNVRFEGQNFVLCHYPMKEWHGKHSGAIHLHGHCHAQYGSKQLRRMIAEKRYDVGVDMYGGPVRLSGDLRFLNNAKGWE